MELKQLFALKKIHEKQTNINVISIWKKRFIRGNFFIPDARKGWKKFAIPVAEKIISENDIQLVITAGPPHSTHLGADIHLGPPGRWLRRGDQRELGQKALREGYPKAICSSCNRSARRVSASSWMRSKMWFIP